MDTKQDRIFHSTQSIEDGTPCTDREDGSHLKKQLKERHIQLIALCGMIGTGLFLSSGNVLATSGPLGALLSYMVMGIFTLGIAYTSGETAALYPTTGAFVRHASKYIEPAVGAATGWNFWYTMSISAPAELSAAATVCQYWTDLNLAIFISIFIVFVISINMVSVKFYGESEVIFGMMKIFLIVGMIIGGIVLTCGGGPDHQSIGFRYWHHPGPFKSYILQGSSGNFLAWWSTLIQAAYAYGNIQVVFIASSETLDARHQISKAMKKLVFRILFFYIATIFVIGLLVSSDNTEITSGTGTAASSPFVIAFEDAGVKVLPSIVNAVVMTSALSSGSACLFIASRTLYGMALDGQAPKFILKCNRFGVPYFAVLLSASMTPLVYMCVSTDAFEVFVWFVNITTLAGLVGWVVVCVSFLRCFYAMKKQNISRDELVFKSPFQPYVAWSSMIFVILVLLFSGFDIFVHGYFSVSGLITCYINLPIFAFLCIFFKITMKSKLLPLEELDLSEIYMVRNEKERILELKLAESNRPLWRKIVGFII
ncbi:hypothetical protein KL906_002857 [Ogataea polymorpha]|nr:hypothetical protein KL906_002857 [Ogataea polymorpha]